MNFLISYRMDLLEASDPLSRSPRIDAGLSDGPQQGLGEIILLALPRIFAEWIN